MSGEEVHPVVWLTVEIELDFPAAGDKNQKVKLTVENNHLTALIYVNIFTYILIHCYDICICCWPTGGAEHADLLSSWGLQDSQYPGCRTPSRLGADWHGRRNSEEIRNNGRGMCLIFFGCFLTFWLLSPGSSVHRGKCTWHVECDVIT